MDKVEKTSIFKSLVWVVITFMPSSYLYSQQDAKVLPNVIIIYTDDQ